MIGIAQLKGGILCIVNIINHHSIDPIIIGGVTVAGKIKTIIFREAKVKIKSKTKISEIRIVIP